MVPDARCSLSDSTSAWSSTVCVSTGQRTARAQPDYGGRGAVSSCERLGVGIWRGGVGQWLRRHCGCCPSSSPWAPFLQPQTHMLSVEGSRRLFQKKGKGKGKLVQYKWRGMQRKGGGQEDRCRGRGCLCGPFCRGCRRGRLAPGAARLQSALGTRAAPGARPSTAIDSGRRNGRGTRKEKKEKKKRERKVREGGTRMSNTDGVMKHRQRMMLSVGKTSVGKTNVARSNVYGVPA
eukprot:653927-Rhodomonas_salina.3